MKGGYTPLPPDERPLREQVETIWKRDLHQLPVWKDFPRLAGGFEIVNGNTKRLIFKEGDEATRAEACKEIINVLAHFFPEPASEEKMQRRKLEALSDSVQDSHEECELGDADDDLLADAEDEQELGHSQPSPSPERVKNATFSPTLAPRRSRSPRKRNSGFSASPRLRGEVFADFVSSVYDDMIPNHCRCSLS